MIFQMETESAATASPPPPTTTSASVEPKLPVCILVLGMAGSGKTTFIQRINAHLHSEQTPPYVVNLDPAVHELPYPCNVDIRDTVNYKQVMKQYSLGPNGAIVTSLNLFSTTFDQLLSILEKNQSKYRYYLFDTPGQIEVFTWSASGTIITEALGATYPTIVVYIMDTPRSSNPITFMSNMLYAVSILYKYRLPFIVVLNKTDIIHHRFALEWMNDFELFQSAIEQEHSYSTDLCRSLSLVLDEFYSNLRCVGFSSMTGDGCKEFFDAVNDACHEYEHVYRVEYNKWQEKRSKRENDKREKDLKRLKNDLDSEANLIGEKRIRYDEDDNEETDDDDDDDEDDKKDDDGYDREDESFKRYLSKHTSKTSTMDT
jgi:GTPase SAR1 family protein